MNILYQPKGTTETPIPLMLTYPTDGNSSDSRFTSWAELLTVNEEAELRVSSWSLISVGSTLNCCPLDFLDQGQERRLWQTHSKWDTHCDNTFIAFTIVYFLNAFFPYQLYLFIKIIQRYLDVVIAVKRNDISWSQSGSHTTSFHFISRENEMSFDKLPINSKQ